MAIDIKKSEFKNLVVKLAHQEVDRTGKDYKECIDGAIEEAKLRLGVDKNSFSKMFV